MVTTWLVVETKYLVFNDFLVIRWSKWSTRRRIPCEVTTWLLVEIKYLVFYDFLVVRWSKWNTRRRILVWDSDDESVGCTPECCVPGWMLHTAGSQVSGDRVRSIWWLAALVTTQEKIGRKLSHCLKSLYYLLWLCHVKTRMQPLAPVLLQIFACHKECHAASVHRDRCM